VEDVRDYDSSTDGRDTADRLRPAVYRPAAEETSLTVVCPPGKSAWAYIALAIAGVYAEVIESPLAVNYFYVARHTPIPISPIPLVYRG
jgi:hypothetical protein